MLTLKEENKEHLYQDESLFIRDIEYYNTTAIHKFPCTEIFLQGCLRAHEQNPCIGCFNPETHLMNDGNNGAKIRDIKLLAEMLINDSQRKITICGGEPMLQAQQLAKLISELRKSDDNFIVYSYTGLDIETILRDGVLDTKGRYLKYSTSKDIKDYLLQLDLFVDGEFQLENKKPNKNGYHSVGSTNQRKFKVDRKNSKLIQIDEITEEPTGFIITL
jgi:organic radical activating enzyme